MNTTQKTYCGFVALVGRPNVGKSTLLNRLLGQKVSITSKKPQTTRHRILGIQTKEQTQIIYVDTPGIHSRAKRALNRYMNKAASSSLLDVDLIVFMLDSLTWTAADDFVLEKIKAANCGVLLLINKIDRIKDKAQLLPFIKEIATKMSFIAILPVSAKTGEQLDVFENLVMKQLPPNPFFYPSDQVTDKSERFLVAELIREKLFRGSGQELPYGTTVSLEKFSLEGKADKKIYHICALIVVEKESHKRMFIGKQGNKLKEIGRHAREAIEVLIEHKVYLQLWIKVKTGWSDDQHALRSLGYEE